MVEEFVKILVGGNVMTDHIQTALDLCIISVANRNDVTVVEHNALDIVAAATQTEDTDFYRSFHFKNFISFR